MTVLSDLHPVVRTWFERRFKAPTDAQRDGWPHILAGRDTLISAPTGSGKTLAAFLAAIDDLPTLNRLQERAYAACIDQFDWRCRGETFISQTAGL